MEAGMQNCTFLDLHLATVNTPSLKAGECPGFGANLQPNLKKKINVGVRFVLPAESSPNYKVKTRNVMLTNLSVTNSHAEIMYGLLGMLLFSYFSFLWVPQIQIAEEHAPREKEPFSCGEMGFTMGGGDHREFFAILLGWPMLRIPQVCGASSPCSSPGPIPVDCKRALLRNGEEGVKLDPFWGC